jgi:hypothetical protein
MKYWLSTTNLAIRKSGILLNFKKIDVYYIIRTQFYLQANVHHSCTLCLFEELMKYIIGSITLLHGLRIFYMVYLYIISIDVLLLLSRAQM